MFSDSSTGDRIPVMSADYGFRSGAGRLYGDSYGAVPRSIFELSMSNFKKELMAMRRSIRMDEFSEISEARGGNDSFLRKTTDNALAGLRAQLARLDTWLEDENVLKSLDQPKNALREQLSDEQWDILQRLKTLQLDDHKVAQAEREREAENGKVEAPLIVRWTYNSLCWMLDVLYAGRPVQRFWVLETVARIPYFSYISMLHLYESLGWWRAGAEVRKVHFAEEWNELHHLQIMESLGGDQLWVDRFVAEHAAVFYYWALMVMYALSPSSSYALSELIEHHATDTYTVFAEQNKEILKTIPPPLVALNYYKSGDLYMFDSLCTEWYVIAYYCKGLAGVRLVLCFFLSLSLSLSLFPSPSLSLICPVPLKVRRVAKAPRLQQPVRRVCQHPRRRDRTYQNDVRSEDQHAERRRLRWRCREDQYHCRVECLGRERVGRLVVIDGEVKHMKRRK